MKNTKRVCLALFLALSAFYADFSFAQNRTIDQLKADLVSPWLVTVSGEARTRILIIKGVVHRDADTYLLEAEYGFTDEKQTAVKAELSQVAEVRKLSILTQSNSSIVTNQLSADAFAGSFTNNTGKTKDVRISKLSVTELQAMQDALRKETTIEMPSENVPASCAYFSGKWSGNWTSGGIGRITLIVLSVDTNCMAKIKYSRNPVEVVEIRDGELKWMCNKSTSGTCILRRKGEDITANYSNPAGGSNFAYFERVR